MDLTALTIHELRRRLVRREVSVTEVVRRYLERIEALDPRVNSYVKVMADEALEEAARYDRGEKDLEGPPLAGVPLSVKDVLCTRGIRTSCGSKILENYLPPYDATVIEKLKASGAVLLGKTNMDEFAMGSSTESSAFGPTRNPWDLDRVPGGSSGGSAAAVAADLCAGSLGTDTGGSIRQPGSFCGVVGLKPTYGRVSRFGLVAFASSLDQIGPITKDVRDAALLLHVVAGYDRRDSTSVDLPVPDYPECIREPVDGLRLGIPREYFVEGMHPDVLSRVRQAIETCRELGGEVVEVSLPHTAYGVAAYYIIAPAEASSNLARYDGVKYGTRASDARELAAMYRETRSRGFGPEVKRRIMLGTYVLSAGYYDAYYRKASQVRTLIRQDFLDAFQTCDALLTPVVPTPAFRVGEKTGDPLQMYLSDVFTLPASLAGIPGISVPCGFTSEGLPVGLQILGPHFREDLVLRIARHFEEAAGFSRRKPDLCA
ncbi:MAG TPA: Asp-tRNA(Asn)/Glu-tRNA(Gln) amidotransferase subunit GatA [Syntrophobacteraceae bacterium]|nr:Asp-tRNA(Asn)/Glu-tRNA(Gln) amidotransferase subunit GatA [Syntrophobacteraceae bacterium]